jgi:uncharacterized LabA/DUF88 family protein
MRPRAALFADVVNLFDAAERAGGRVDYERYLARAAAGYDLVRAVAYGAQMRREAESFLAVLRGLGYETCYRRAVVTNGRPDIRQTHRSLTLAMDVWRTFDRLDAVILGSNDPDLLPLAARLKELGRQVVLFAPAVGPELRELADRCLDLGDALVDRGVVIAKSTPTDGGRRAVPEMVSRHEAAREPEPLELPADRLRDGAGGPGR